MSAHGSTDVWEPLPAAGWDEAAARHLLRRIGWAATPETVAVALDTSLTATLERAFPRQGPTFPEPESIKALRAFAEAMSKRIRSAQPEERRALRREARERFRQCLQDFTLQWLQHASRPENAAFEKWVLFLSDVYVVATSKVRNPAMIHDHFALLHSHALGAAPLLTKAVLRSPAMIDYLDLQQSRRGAPNENFARELFELFLLGEGHYTESDIKEAARAFTGYRQRNGQFHFMARQHDDDAKTLFGRTGDHDGDEVVDLTYRQPAASRFLPAQLARFYLSEAPLPPAELARLGVWWKETGFDLRRLALRFFSSRLFFAPEHRGNAIKSPVQFHLGLMQDLRLDVTPLPGLTLRPLQQMGQELFNPPNVRGWVGGRAWINSVTLAARRQLVQNLFRPIAREHLNADEQIELVAAEAQGRDRFTVDAASLNPQAYSSRAEVAARQLVDNFLPVPVSPEFTRVVTAALTQDGSSSVAPRRLHGVVEVMLQSPEYQLC